MAEGRESGAGSNSNSSLEAGSLLPIAPQQTSEILQGVTTVPPNPEVEQQLVHPGRVRRHDDPMDLVHLAQSVMKADQFVRATTHGKLTVIVDQIRALQAMARDVLETAKRDAQLHHAACNFTKVPGKTYHLYEREPGNVQSCYFSMLSPQDWGAGKCPHKHMCSYRLEYDHSWTPVEEIERRSKDIDAINKVIDAHALPHPQYSIEYNHQ